MENVKLGKIVKIQKGKKHELATDISKNSVRFIQIDDLRNDNNLKYTNEEKGIHANLNDLLIAWDGANAGTIGFGKTGFIGSTIALLRINEPDKYDSIFLGYLLKNNNDFLRQTSTGATIPHISRSALDSIRIPNISIQDQQKIAYILLKAEALIQKRKETLKLLDEFLKSTFLDIFGDPVKNPKGWEKIELGNMGESRLGKMLDSSKQTGENTYPYLGNSNVLWGKFNLENLQTMDFSESERIEFELKEGDLIICEGGEIGRTAIWKNQMQKVYFQKALHRVRINNEKANADYIQYVMWFYAKLTGFKSIIGTATISHLTGVQLKRIKFPVPPLPLQTQFAKIVEKVEGIKQQQEASLKEIENLYNSLMQRGFKGELALGEVQLENKITDLKTSLEKKLSKDSISKSIEKNIGKSLVDTIKESLGFGEKIKQENDDDDDDDLYGDGDDDIDEVNNTTQFYDISKNGFRKLILQEYKNAKNFSFNEFRTLCYTRNKFKEMPKYQDLKDFIYAELNDEKGILKQTFDESLPFIRFEIVK